MYFEEFDLEGNNKNLTIEIAASKKEVKVHNSSDSEE